MSLRYWLHLNVRLAFPESNRLREDIVFGILRVSCDSLIAASTSAPHWGPEPILDSTAQASCDLKGYPVDTPSFRKTGQPFGTRQ